MTSRRRSRGRRHRRHSPWPTVAVMIVALVVGLADSDDFVASLERGAWVAAILFVVGAAVVAVTSHWPLLRRSPNVTTIEELRALTPYEFEHKVAQLLRDAGFTRVRVSGGAGDLQADVTAVSPRGRTAVVQCKRYAEGNNIGSPEIQTFIGMAKLHHQAEIGMFVTTSAFTRPATELAQHHNIVLVDGEGIVNGVRDEVRAAGFIC